MDSLWEQANHNKFYLIHNFPSYDFQYLRFEVFPWGSCRKFLHTVQPWPGHTSAILHRSNTVNSSSRLQNGARVARLMSTWLPDSIVILLVKSVLNHCIRVHLRCVSCSLIYSHDRTRCREPQTSHARSNLTNEILHQ